MTHNYVRMDANEYALKAQAAANGFAPLVREAQWLGTDDAPALTVEPGSMPAAATAGNEETPSLLSR
jgi:hypothetical protein